jgi:hypothetical protein
LPQLSGEQGTEFQHPSPDGLVGDLDAALGEQLLDIPEAQGEAEIEPHGVPDDGGREPVAGE